jgi:hypothetical protein
MQPVARRRGRRRAGRRKTVAAQAGFAASYAKQTIFAPVRPAGATRAEANSAARGNERLPMTTTVRLQIALLFYTTVNIVAFTAAVYAATMFPPLLPHAGFWIAAFTGVSMFVTVPVAWWVGTCLPSIWHDRLIAQPSPLSRAPSREI